MNFSLAKGINSLGTHIHNSAINVYLSTPEKDFVNPGFNLHLYSDIVPIGSTALPGSSMKRAEKEEKSEDLAKKLEIDNPLQTGAGKEDLLIEASFEHPRPIKTEIIDAFHKEVVSKTSSKRKNDTIKQNVTGKKSKSIKHNFQLV